jgi:hypothetical protein
LSHTKWRLLTHHSFNDVWQIFNTCHLDPGRKKMKEDCDTNWKVVEMNLPQDTDVTFIEWVNRDTYHMTVNYNE